MRTMQKQADIDADSRRFATACPGQWLYLLDDEGVIYSEEAKSFCRCLMRPEYPHIEPTTRAPELRIEGFNLRGSSPTSDDRIHKPSALSQGVFPR